MFARRLPKSGNNAANSFYLGQNANANAFPGFRRSPEAAINGTFTTPKVVLTPLNATRFVSSWLSSVRHSREPPGQPSHPGLLSVRIRGANFFHKHRKMRLSLDD